MVVTLKEHDFVKSIVSIPNGDRPIKPNTMGSIISVFKGGEAYEVEFLTGEFNLDIATVSPSQIEVLWVY